MFQRWHDLLFAHWALPPEQVRALLPAQLELDTFDGRAYLAITPFWMSHVRIRGFPPLPGLSSFPELNVRTYVRFREQPGVYFFSLDASNAVAVWAARRLYELPYFWARMFVSQHDSGISYRSERRDRQRSAQFDAHYAPNGETFRSRPGTLESFLTERYYLYTVREKRVSRVGIDHEPWPLQPATADIRATSLAAHAGIRLNTDLPSSLLFARRLDVRIWLPERLS